jgi:hypothetical protein
MALIAHARIEDPEDPTRVWDRGDEVSAEDAERLGLERQFGAVSEEEYDPAADKNEPPQYVEIDGVRYERNAPAPDAEEDSDA